MARRKPEAHQEEHPDETWLIPYSDILTLLLALFIVLFATASVDAQKLEQMAQSFNAAFNGSPSVFDKQSSIAESQNGAPAAQDSSDANKEQAMESVQLNEVKKKLDKYIQNNNLTGDLQTSLTVDGLVIRIQDTALFTSGRADMRPESRRWAHEIAAMLGTLSQSIVVSGHTDNVPINTAEFPSNWDLSSKRALNFMKFLLAEDPQLQPERFSAIGFGEYRPLAVNTAPDGRAKNRRVEVLILKQYH